MLTTRPLRGHDRRVGRRLGSSAPPRGTLVGGFDITARVLQHPPVLDRFHGLAIVALVLSTVAVGTARAQDPTRATAGGAQCTLSDVVELGTTTERGIAVGTAYASPGHGMVVWSADSEHLASRAIDGATLSPTHTTAFAHAHDLALLAGAGTDYLALTTVALCTSLGLSCFQMHGLHADGSATGPPLAEAPSGQNAVMEGWAPAPRGVFVAGNTRFGPGRIARYTLEANGGVTVRSLATQPVCAGGIAYAAIASRAEQAFALSRPEDGCDEAGPRTLRVLPGDASHAVRGLPLEAQIDRLVIDDGGAWLVFHVGRAAARIAHVRPDSSFSERPRAAAAGALPPALAELVVPVVDVRGSTVTLRRTDAVGRPVGAPAVISTTRASRIETAVAFSGTELVVVYARRERDGWHVAMRRARCA